MINPVRWTRNVSDINKHVRVAAIITTQTGTQVFSRKYKSAKLSESAKSGHGSDIIVDLPAATD
ncbi:hypothetical protein BDFB_004107 [Asbolus verrucosus]|uniref:Uncharacterized protein n=1 Tax=Asbolus verrucosus TaxID=1661398 RepID=A0A482VHT1_ASBVE|nr:hypothetical protein BDFB_004107 [Asbolus verrucosus]